MAGNLIFAKAHELFFSQLSCLTTSGLRRSLCISMESLDNQVFVAGYLQTLFIMKSISIAKDAYRILTFYTHQRLIYVLSTESLCNDCGVFHVLQRKNLEDSHIQLEYCLERSFSRILGSPFCNPQDFLNTCA